MSFEDARLFDDSGLAVENTVLREQGDVEEADHGQITELQGQQLALRGLASTISKVA